MLVKSRGGGEGGGHSEALFKNKTRKKTETKRQTETNNIIANSVTIVGLGIILVSATGPVISEGKSACECIFLCGIYRAK